LLRNVEEQIPMKSARDDKREANILAAKGVPFDSLRSLRAGSSTAFAGLTPLRMTVMKSIVPTLSQKTGKDGAPSDFSSY
jgi:hypothetical protein